MEIYPERFELNMANGIVDQYSVELEKQLREAVREVMAAEELNKAGLAKVQELLDEKAAHLRAPFSKKLRRILMDAA